MAIEAIIFDNDGVLVDSEIIHIAVERELLAEHGLEYSDAVYKSRFVGLSMPDFYAALYVDFRAANAKPLPSGFGEELRARAWPRIEAELKAVSGAASLLQSFAGPCAVASSAPLERVKIKLALTNLLRYFGPHVYSSEHVSNGKPAPDLFQLAARKLGIEPSRCLVIEDSVHGVLAARAADMPVIGFTGGSHADQEVADRLRAAGATTIANSHFEIKRLWQSGFDLN
ncbi:MAG: HAD family phosphatase [Pseudomonadota bacterium]